MVKIEKDFLLEIYVPFFCKPLKILEINRYFCIPK